MTAADQGDPVPFGPGSTIGHYRIESLLGTGGMGMVYRALDTRLNRAVAIKFLSGNLAAADRRRFQQEARAASSLNHPHILTVHDADEFEGHQYLVTEVVDGGTLADWAKAERRSWRQVTEILAGVADALAVAHAAGILHRDVKPANILVARGGYAKLADFGLAKLITGSDVDPTRTTSDARTRLGTVLGTIPYMSPEQISGRALDARSDIFSFGVVLYELLAGRRPFTGGTDLECLHSVLHQSPVALPPEIPSRLCDVIEKALEKDPADRYQSMHDFMVDLRRISRGHVEPTIARPAPARRSAVSILAGALIVAIAGDAGVRWFTAAPATTTAWKLTRLTNDSGLTTTPAISRDGTLLAYASDRSGEGNLDLYVQQVGGGRAVRITTEPANDLEPSFSPDGRTLAFRSERAGGGVYLVSALGGEARLLAPGGYRPRFSPDGQWVAYFTGSLGGDFSPLTATRTHVIAASGGEPRQIQPGFAMTRYPVWSPDGRRLLFYGSLQTPSTEREWWVSPLDGGQAVPAGASPVMARADIPSVPAPDVWDENGVTFSASLGSGASLWRVDVSPSGTLTGSPVQLTSGVGGDVRPSTARGRIVFTSMEEDFDIWGWPADTNRAVLRGSLQRLTSSPAHEDIPTVSLDGRRLAYRTDVFGNFDLWVKDLDTGSERAVVVTPRVEGQLALDHAGDIGMYLDNAGDRTMLRFIGITANARLPISAVPCDNCASVRASGDPGRVLYWHREQGRIGQLDLISHRQTIILQHPDHPVLRFHSSADGKWIAFTQATSPLGGRIFIAPLAAGPVDPGKWIALTDGLAFEYTPVFSPDGNRVYYLSDRDGNFCVRTQRLDPATKMPAGPPEVFLHFHDANRVMDVAASGAWSLSVAVDKIVLPLRTRSGNIWLAERQSVR